MKRIILAAALVAMPATAQQATTPVAQQSGTTTVALPGPRVKPAQGPGEVSKNAPVNGVLTLFGNERCPTDNDGNEIVVCVRRSAEEQFRVPKELREFQITPQNESWAARAQGTLDTGVGVNGTGSCSAVGAGGATGCFLQRVRETKATNAARKLEESRAPGGGE